ncbi:MAG: FGGY family carbohydrate kinase [Bacteroidia bacterium]|nr:FGGY family carbohydrate kinase [Bacteroidia bacterium]
MAETLTPVGPYDHDPDYDCMYFIGYDIGSATIRAALFDGNTHQEICRIQYPDTEMEILARQRGWAEQQPEMWWMYLCMATRRLLDKSRVAPADIKGIGISYQMHGLVLIDAACRVLRPAIIWCDSRAVNIGKQAFEDVGKTYCLENLLNSPGNFTASRLRWVRDHEPDVYRQVYKMLLPGDFIAMKLTGEVNTTLPGLSEAICWDFKERRLAYELLQYYEIPESLIPDLVPTFSIQGRLTPEAANMTGLLPGTPLCYRAGDQPNHALSLNVLKPNEFAATSSASGVVYGIVDRPVYDIHSRINAFAHVNYQDNQDRIGMLLCLNGAGSQYSWIKHQVAHTGQSYQDLERIVKTIPVGADGLCTLPFGNGAERMLENRNLNAHILNLQFGRHTRAHLYRSALEGVAFSFVSGVNILKQIGLDVGVIRVSNDDMFQSETFSTTIATLLDCQIEVVETNDAVGAARAAGVAIGHFAHVEDAVSGIRPHAIHEPVLDMALCQQAYNLWLANLQKMTQEPASSRNYQFYKLRHETLQQEIIEKEKALTLSSLRQLTQQNLLKEARDTLAQLRRGGVGEGDMTPVADLIRKLDHQLKVDKSWEEFVYSFDMLQSGFFQHLKDTYPQLSADEMKLCAYLRMDMASKDIADQLNISLRGVETRRYRLRKKLNLPAQVSLTEFIQHLQVSQSAS